MNFPSLENGQKNSYNIQLHIITTLSRNYSYNYSKVKNGMNCDTENTNEIDNNKNLNIYFHTQCQPNINLQNKYTKNKRKHNEGII